MAVKMFVNIAVKDLPRSIAFWKGLGFAFHQQFTDETGACLVFGEDNYAMLLTHDKFKQFAPHPISDANKQTEVLVALGLDSKEAVVEKMEKALATGARRFAQPKDYGFMFQDSFQDFDGHVWELFYMDPKAIPG